MKFLGKKISRVSILIIDFTKCLSLNEELLAFELPDVCAESVDSKSNEKCPPESKDSVRFASCEKSSKGSSKRSKSSTYSKSSTSMKSKLGCSAQCSQQVKMDYEEHKKSLPNMCQRPKARLEICKPYKEPKLKEPKNKEPKAEPKEPFFSEELKDKIKSFFDPEKIQKALPFLEKKSRKSLKKMKKMYSKFSKKDFQCDLEDCGSAISRCSASACRSSKSSSKKSAMSSSPSTKKKCRERGSSSKNVKIAKSCSFEKMASESSEICRDFGKEPEKKKSSLSCCPKRSGDAKKKSPKKKKEKKKKEKKKGKCKDFQICECPENTAKSSDSNPYPECSSPETETPKPEKKKSSQSCCPTGSGKKKKKRKKENCRGEFEICECPENEGAKENDSDTECCCPEGVCEENFSDSKECKS
ncbi:histone H1-I [Orussus abietinus]|uniref:histone H1-I n=1 Tax=Orussus abietinus TaxID=222816 RepID=UPI000626D8C8|nr:histone H1-I [Orussus abietinus]